MFFKIWNPQSWLRGYSLFQLFKTSLYSREQPDDLEKVGGRERGKTGGGQIIGQ